MDDDFYRINKLQARQNSVWRRADEAQHTAENVELRLGRLALLTQALWELLSARTGVSDDELAAKMEEIDLRDGQRDGKLAEPVAHCPACKRAVHKRHLHCLYCGADVSRAQLP